MPSAAPVPLCWSLPTWVARPPGRPIDDAGQEGAAARVGAALAALDAVWRARPAYAGAWAGRLGVLAAGNALAAAGQAGDADAVRDLLAAHPSPPAAPPVGPAAPAAAAWAWLAAGPAAARWDDAPEKLAGLGARTGDAAATLAKALADAAARPCPLAAVVHAAAATREIRPGRPALALFAADVALARWLDWPRGLPLAALGARRGKFSADDDGAAAALIVGGAMAALDLGADLARRAAALEAIRPRLRARNARRVADRLLERDALTVASVGDLIPERAARRLFDRLTALGGARELTGRPAFRRYGL